MMSRYESQSARDAEATGYGDQSYWDYLDDTAKRHRDYYLTRGNKWEADRMMSCSLSDSLVGNDGE
jgi:hypothetical protein